MIRSMITAALLTSILGLTLAVVLSEPHHEGIAPKLERTHARYVEFTMPPLRATMFAKGYSSHPVICDTLGEKAHFKPYFVDDITTYKFALVDYVPCTEFELQPPTWTPPWSMLPPDVLDWILARETSFEVLMPPIEEQY